MQVVADGVRERGWECVAVEEAGVGHKEQEVGMRVVQQQAGAGVERDTAMAEGVRA